MSGVSSVSRPGGHLAYPPAPVQKGFNISDDSSEFIPMEGYIHTGAKLEVPVSPTGSFKLYENDGTLDWTWNYNDLIDLTIPVAFTGCWYFDHTLGRVYCVVRTAATNWMLAYVLIDTGNTILVGDMGNALDGGFTGSFGDWGTAYTFMCQNDAGDLVLQQGALNCVIDKSDGSVVTAINAVSVNGYSVDGQSYYHTAETVEGNDTLYLASDGFIHDAGTDHVNMRVFREGDVRRFFMDAGPMIPVNTAATQTRIVYIRHADGDEICFYTVVAGVRYGAYHFKRDAFDAWLVRLANAIGLQES